MTHRPPSKNTDNHSSKENTTSLNRPKSVDDLVLGPTVRQNKPNWGQRIKSHIPGILLTGALTVLAMIVNHFVPLANAMLVAIVLGMVIANIRKIHSRHDVGIGFASKHLLRTGIVLLGLQISLATLAGLGWQRLLLVVTIVAIGVVTTYWIGRWLKLSKSLVGAIACGFSICGAAAVAGVKDVIRATKDETATALALVVVYGTISIPLVPLMASVMNLEAQTAGTWAGGSIHEVAQVVAAGAAIGDEGLAIAVSVKLARVVCLAGVVAVLSILHRRTENKIATKRPPVVPLFVLGFLAMVIFGSIVPIPNQILASVKIIQTAALTMAMAGLGLGIKVKELIKVGPKPVVLGFISTVIVSGIALGGAILI